MSCSSDFTFEELGEAENMHLHVPCVCACECVRVVGEVFAQSEFASFDENVSAFPLGLYLKFSLILSCC